MVEVKNTYVESIWKLALTSNKVPDARDVQGRANSQTRATSSAPRSSQSRRNTVGCRHRPCSKHTSASTWTTSSGSAAPAVAGINAGALDVAGFAVGGHIGDLLVVRHPALSRSARTLVRA